MAWATFWANFSQTNLVTLISTCQSRNAHNLAVGPAERQGCQIFLGQKHTKMGKINQTTANYIYQIAINYTKWPQNIPRPSKIFQGLPKYTKL
jgi:hypothetical protein